jgi:hypothetical protein
MRLARFRTRRWLPSGRLARRSRGPLLGGVWVHCRTRWRRHRCDAELAGGADPMGSDELSLRAGQLRSEKSRAHLVCALRGAVELADRQSDPLRVPPLPIRREIRENRALLLELAERLAADRPLTVKGVAMSSLWCTTVTVRSTRRRRAVRSRLAHTRRSSPSGAAIRPLTPPMTSRWIPYGWREPAG